MYQLMLSAAVVKVRSINFVVSKNEVTPADIALIDELRSVLPNVSSRLVKLFNRHSR